MNLTNKRFGRLIAINPVRRGRYLKWVCKCDCGKFTEVVAQYLRAGRTKSCGCFRREIARERFTKHDCSTTVEYRIWASMKSRCFYPKHRYFSHYGARGITVCARWLNSFVNFYADMGPRPPGMTLERKDNNGNYEPSNCIWATQKTQANNKRSNHKLTHKGRTQTLSQWSEFLGINQRTIMSRLKQGWNVGDTLVKSLSNHGSKHYLAKFCDADIINMRALYAGGERLKDIAETYGTRPSHIHGIVNRRIWKHI